MNLDKLYAVDEDAAKNGKWMITREGFEVKVAKLGNPDFVAEVQRLQKPHLAILNSRQDTSELLNTITVKAMAKTILTDWKAEDDKGKPVKYTPELGEQAMLKHSDFKEDISALAANRDNYKPGDVAGK